VRRYLNRLDMKKSICTSLLCCLCGALTAATAPDGARLLATAPLRFEPAATGSSSEFVARGARFCFSFTAGEATFQTGKRDIKLRFEGAAQNAHLQGIDTLRSKTNVFAGNDATKWRRAIPNFGRLQVHDLYHGVDLVYYGNAGELEYDLNVKPGTDPNQIRLRLEGANARVDRNGNLIAGLIQKRPVAYQIDSNGTRVAVYSRYRKNADGTYGFALGAYERGRELVIDPVLTLSTWLSGAGQDIIYAIGHDAIGFLYVAGQTYSPDLAIGGNAPQPTFGGSTDVYVAKIDPHAAQGSQIVFATYLGGTSDETLGGMAVGPLGDIYLTGATNSTNFPVVNAALGTLAGTTGSDAFVAWIDSSQNLAYSTFLGGASNDAGQAITFDGTGRLYVTGDTLSDDFPAGGGFQTTRKGSQDAFLAVIDLSQTGAATLQYATYLGGSGVEAARGIAVAADRTVWIVGQTFSNDFPVAGLSYQPNYSSGGDAFVAHINPNTNTLVYATYLGGSDQDLARNVIVDPAGRVIVSGYTLSQDFPSTPDALQPQYGGNTDAFVTILDPSATSRQSQLVYSTFFGGSNGDVPFDMKRDSAGNIYLAGMTLSPGLPTTANSVQQFYDNTMDAFALKFNPAQPGKSGLQYFTYLGGPGLQVAYAIDFDSTGNIFLAGFTSGPIFDSFSGPGKPSNHGNRDGFVIGFNTSPTPSASERSTEN
jgi:Beta-propeller repeat